MGERGFYCHGMSLCSQEVHVPLVVIPPDELSAAVSVPEPLSLRDIPTTVADVLDTRKGSPFPGDTLARYWKPRQRFKTTVTGPVISEASLRQKVSQNLTRPPAWRGPMSALVSDGLTCIRNADGSEELSDISAVKQQGNDLAHSAAARLTVNKLRAALKRLCPELPWK